MPRPQKYDWDDKRDICYKLYVEEKLSAQKIVEYFAKHFNTPESELPPSRQFNRRFQLWGFPVRSFKLTAETEVQIVDRTKELFQQNLQARQILEKLNEEGWEIDQFHFRNLRKKHGLLLRAAGEGFENKPKNKKRQREAAEDDQEEDQGEDPVGETLEQDVANLDLERQAPPGTLPPDEAARRAQRLTELQLQSDHLLQTKKRRRRIRGYGHLPPDTPGMQPRYKSETSLDECKAYLHLTNEQYATVREQYEAICREMGIIKVSLCAEGQWQAAKDRLIRENMHLSSVLHPLQQDVEQRLNALNCICQDVTKRMRNLEKAMSIADANNILSLNPNESKEVRRLLYEILLEDHFTTVVACGKEHLQHLHQQWYAKSDTLQNAMNSGDPQKARAVFVLSKDARKRYCDDMVKKSPNKRQWKMQKLYGPGPGPAQNTFRAKKTPVAATGEWPQTAAAAAQTTSTSAQATSAPAKPARQWLIPAGPAWEGVEYPPWKGSSIADAVPHVTFDLDPLLSTTHGPPWPPQADWRGSNAPAQANTTNIASYFRLAPDSQFPNGHPRMWLGKLAGPTMDALHKAAVSKADGTRVAKVNGLVWNNDGSEDSWLIENDDELNAYLAESGEKPTFVVVLQYGYA